MPGTHHPSPTALLRPLLERDLARLRDWFDDPESRRRLGGILDLTRWFAYVQSQPSYYAWLALDGSTPVGFAFLEINPAGIAAIALLVAPGLRRRGYGVAILRAVLALPEVHGLRAVEAGVEHDNAASIACFRAAGFT